MPKIVIPRWDNGETIHEGEFADLREAVADAVAKKISLYRANLSYSDLRGSDLSYSNLSGSDLRGSYLSGSDLSVFRRDIEHVLFCNPNEAQAVVDALEAGKVDGSFYEGECACLVGTIRNARGCELNAIEMDSNRPAERWFTQFVPGRSCENYSPAKLTADWIRDWIAKHGPEVNA